VGHANAMTSSHTMGYTIVGSCHMQRVPSTSYQWSQRVRFSTRRSRRQQWWSVLYWGLLLTCMIHKVGRTMRASMLIISMLKILNPISMYLVFPSSWVCQYHKPRRCRASTHHQSRWGFVHLMSHMLQTHSLTSSIMPKLEVGGVVVPFLGATIK
jgi:hypothetical protein